MTLFNKYQNKNFTFLTRYINGIVDEDSIGMTEDQIRELLVGEQSLTYEDFPKELANKMKSPNKNAAILYPDNDGILRSILDNPVPVRATLAERAWLYYYIQQPEAKLFLDEDIIVVIKNSLLEDDFGDKYPLSDRTFSVRETTTNKELFMSDSIITTFRTILKAIHQRRYIYTDNVGGDGTKYENSKLLPFRFEYLRQSGSLYVSALSIPSQGTGRSIKLSISKLKNTYLGESVEEYDDKFKKYFDSLNLTLGTNAPLTIKIDDYHNGFDRTVYTFANYRRESYRDENGSIIMKIFFRNSQSYNLVRKLLFLGPAITVLGPDSIREQYVDALRKALENYTMA